MKCKCKFLENCLLCRLEKSRRKWVGHVERMDEYDMQGYCIRRRGGGRLCLSIDCIKRNTKKAPGKQGLEISSQKQKTVEECCAQGDRVM